MMKETPERTQNSLTHWLKTLSIYDLMLFGAIILFFIIASIGYGANSIQSASFNVLKGRFDYLEKHQMYQDIGYSYELKLLESSQKYIIKADYADCLDIALCDATLKKGDPIFITTQSSNESLILSIKKGSTTLMDMNCVHTETNRINIFIPMLIALSIILLWWLQRKIKQDRHKA